MSEPIIRCRKCAAIIPGGDEKCPTCGASTKKSLPLFKYMPKLPPTSTRAVMLAISILLAFSGFFLLALEHAIYPDQIKSWPFIILRACFLLVVAGVFAGSLYFYIAFLAALHRLWGAVLVLAGIGLALYPSIASRWDVSWMAQLSNSYIPAALIISGLIALIVKGKV